MSNRIRWSFLALFFGLLSASGCSCGDEVLVPITPGTCEPDFTCATGTEYRRGECVTARCQIDADCCPGQKCNAAAGFCGDQYVSCTDDEQCTEVPGQTCIDFRGGQYCGYPNRGNALSAANTQPCVTTADCDEGRTCFSKRCVVFAPCQGGCPEGEICDVDSNTCSPLDTCTATCKPGEMLVVAEPDTMSGPQCCLVECACAVLPPVLPGAYGWYASIDAKDAMVAVASYDDVYGDLVVVQYDDQGNATQVDYVDGFPADGPLVGNPDGPRNGRNGAGEDVGQHASLVIDDAGVVHVAYYDAENGRLKYANYVGGMWTTSIVDESEHVGAYTSIAIDANGNPAIAYMMIEGTVDPDPLPRTGLKYAQANSNMPTSATDWTTTLVDHVEKAPPVCECMSGFSCVDLGNGPECAADSSQCTDTCGMDEVCVENAMATPECATELSIVPLEGLIEGVGLFADLAHTSTGTPVIAYYDKIEGDLKLAVGDGAGGFSVRTLDGNDAMDPTDVGQHASVAVDANDRIGVAYFDASFDDLVYFDVTDGTREIVDDGVSPPDLRLVGADASLVFDAQGNPTIAYQDPTLIDLVYARRTGDPAMWNIEMLRGTDRASGFYASQAILGSSAYVASVDVSFDEESRLLLDLTVMVKSLQ